MIMNQMNSAPSAPVEPTLADKVKAIEDQIEEAHMTFNDALVTELLLLPIVLYTN